MQHIFKSAFGITAGLASIIGVGLLFVRSVYAVATACAFYCIAITVLGIAIYRSILKSLEFGNKGTYRHLASFGTFVCDDGKMARFENVRLIQAKVPFLEKIEHKYKWRGSGCPKIYANGSMIPNEQKVNNLADSYDSVFIKLDRVLSFNECASVQISFESPLSEPTPRICYKVEDPTEMLLFKVLLGFVTDKLSPAVLTRRRISSEVNSAEEHIGNVDYDVAHRSYLYIMHKPEIGYYYTLSWVMP
ncbi:hypothetical protein [uncultured Fibrobacter sp.]|uniref:hypothetical protein n=1 Tax=uncultured Fibrobacter sp. TaxID=261512 RepID=UPI0025F5E2A0|nr:hypothetical protein [uncultured Fibrobacter sp.]